MREPPIGSYRDAGRRPARARRPRDRRRRLAGARHRRHERHRARCRRARRRPGRPPAGRGDRPRLPDDRRALTSPGRDRRPASPYLSKEEPMPAATAAPARHRAARRREGLRCRVRLADGRVFTGRSRRSATAPCSWASCTSRPAGLSSSPRAPAATGACRSRPGGAPTTSCPADRPARLTGCGHCWRSPRGTPTPARRCSSPRRFGRRRGATSTRSARPAFCGSTSTGPTGCRRCGRSSRSGPVICSSRAAPVTRMLTGSSTGRCRRRR